MAITKYKTLGKAIDALFDKKQELSKLVNDPKITKTKGEVTELEEHVFALLRKQKALGGAGTKAKVTITESNVPVVQDWDNFYRHIQETGDFDLLGRSLKVPAVRERWDDHKEVPGVGVFVKTKLSVTKN